MNQHHQRAHGPIADMGYASDEEIAARLRQLGIPSVPATYGRMTTGETIRTDSGQPVPPRRYPGSPGGSPTVRPREARHTCTWKIWYGSLGVLVATVLLVTAPVLVPVVVVGYLLFRRATR